MFIRILDYLTYFAQRKGDRVGWVIDEKPYSYAQVDALTNKFANALIASGLKKGDRVSLFLPNGLEYLISCYGVAKAGGTVNPLNTMFKKAEIKYIVNDAGSEILITTPELVGNVLEIKDELPLLKQVILTGEPFDQLMKKGSEAAPAVDLKPDDNMFLAYSSGTTGNPKGVIHTHFSASAQAIGTANRLGFSYNDKIITSLPLFHLYGGNIILGGAIVAGACLVVHPRFDVEKILSTVARDRLNIIAGVPTMFAYFNAAPESLIKKYDVSCLDFNVSAGSILFPKVYDDFKRLYGAPILDGYGITEAAGMLTTNYKYGKVVPGSAGPAYPFTHIKIVDDFDNPVPTGEIGELIAKAPQNMKEYWKLPKETAETMKGGYLHTGDLARMDEEGYVFIVDRKKDMIITGGFNIYPAEVENYMNAHPKVAQSAMFGVPDEAKVEVGWAAIVLKEGMSATEEEIIDYCRSQMATYKCPRKVVFMESLPVNVMNKILRRKLRDMFSKSAQ
jgi:long-chain acyl-CoA synthetase